MVSKNLRQEGQGAETLAVDYLKQQGYQILARNYRNNSGEIDIIAQDGNTVCFVEVKMRRSTAFGMPAEAVMKWKMRKLIQVAGYYLKAKKLTDAKARFDVVAVREEDGGIVKVDLFKNAFRLDEVGNY